MNDPRDSAAQHKGRDRKALDRLLADIEAARLPIVRLGPGGDFVRDYYAEHQSEEKPDRGVPERNLHVAKEIRDILNAFSPLVGKPRPEANTGRGGPKCPKCGQPLEFCEATTAGDEGQPGGLIHYPATWTCIEGNCGYSEIDVPDEQEGE